MGYYLRHADRKDEANQYLRFSNSSDSSSGAHKEGIMAKQNETLRRLKRARNQAYKEFPMPETKNEDVKRKVRTKRMNRYYDLLGM